jgi:hypothetical protein
MNALQAQTPWILGGNEPDFGEFIGTTNDFPFIIKTNDTIRMVIDEFGKVTLKTLQGTGIRLIRVNEDGDLVALEPGNNTEILNGEGEWIPIQEHLFEIDGSGNTLLSSGKLKIGSGGSPTKELEVNGQALITSLSTSQLQLTGLGGSGNRILILNSANEADDLEFSGDTKVLNGQKDWVELPTQIGEINGSGDVYFETVKVGIGTSTPTKELQVVGDLLVEGSMFADSLYTQKIKTGELDLGNDTTAYKFGFLPLSGGGISVWGGSVPPASDGGGQVDPFPSCTGWGGPNLFQQSGMFQAYGPNSFLMTPTNSLYRSLFMGVARKNPMTSETHGYIEMTDAKTSPTDGITASILHINTRCGRDVIICNENSGIVTVGNNFEAGKNITRDVSTTMNIHAEGTAIFSKTTHGAPWGYNTVLEVDDDDTKTFEIRNTQNGGTIPFLVMGDGRTAIGAERCTTSTHQDAMLQVQGKIIGQSLYILDPVSNWPDFVFEPEYKLKDLTQVEAYYKEHKHLPGVPTAKEIQQNGVDVLEMNRILLEKVEELTLYMVEQRKMIEEMKVQLNTRKN